jgi:hypothetical protein
MHLIARMKHVALINQVRLPIDLDSWTASPLCVSLHHTYLLVLTMTDLKVDVLQTNTYDCGLWVLAGITAILRGFNITGLKEADMPWFRKYLTGLVMTLPIYNTV